VFFFCRITWTKKTCLYKEGGGEEKGAPCGSSLGGGKKRKRKNLKRGARGPERKKRGEKKEKGGGPVLVSFPLWFEGGKVKDWMNITPHPPHGVKSEKKPN